MTDYYIGPDGDDDTGDGSLGDPWETIAHAMSNTLTTDTVYILAGTTSWEYQEIWSGARHWIGAGADVTILEGAGTGVVGGGLWNNMSPPMIFEDMTFTNAHHTGASESQFRTSGAAILTFRRCIFRQISYPNNRGIWYGFVGLHFDRCLWYDIKSTSGNPDALGGIIGMPTTDLTITNCAIYIDVAVTNERPFILYIAGPETTEAILKNNIFYTTISRRFSNVVSGGDSVEYAGSTNNIFYQYTNEPAGFDEPTSPADPLWVDPANGNFNLRPTSPAINAGVIP